MPTTTRRDFLKTGLAAGGALCASTPDGSEALANANDGERPNIILLVSDDQRMDTLGCYGNDIIQTPHLNRLARNGVLFDNAFATTSICCTSRATILTGQNTKRHKIDRFDQPLSSSQWRSSFPAVLKRAGYRTGFVGKWGVGGALPKEEYDSFVGFPGQGTYFEKVDGENLHRTHIISNQAREFLGTCDKNQPFCLHVGFKAPHCLDGDPRPFHPDPEFDHLYREDRIPVPKTATELHYEELPEFLQISEGRKRWKIRFASPQMFQKTVKDYYRLITGIDYAVGEILATLREKGLDRNTVIVYTSDQGFFLGEKGLAGKWTMHEESIRVPLLVYDPRALPPQKGQNRTEMVLNEDIAPTLLDYAGVGIPPGVQGKSVRPLVEGTDPDWRSSWYYAHLFEHRRIPRCEGVRTTDWKYIRYIDQDPVYEELYNLKSDPLEERNLASEEGSADKLKEMRERWEHLRKTAV